VDLKAEKKPMKRRVHVGDKEAAEDLDGVHERRIFTKPVEGFERLAGKFRLRLVCRRSILSGK
jgi:hypothetical protein